MATLQELQDDLAAFKAARLRILEGSQELRVGSQAYRFADLEVLNREIASLEARIALVRAQQGGNSLNATTAVFRGRR